MPEVAQENMPDDTGSTEELVVKASLYERLRENMKAIPMEDGYLVRRWIDLGEYSIEDEIGNRYFGTSVDDFKRLSRNVCWDYPSGLLLINLDRSRTLYFGPEQAYEAKGVDLDNALEWMLKTPGVLGLTLRSRSGYAECCLFGLVFHMEHARDHLRGRAEALIREVESWS